MSHGSFQPSLSICSTHFAALISHTLVCSLSQNGKCQVAKLTTCAHVHSEVLPPVGNKLREWATIVESACLFIYINATSSALEQSSMRPSMYFHIEFLHGKLGLTSSRLPRLSKSRKILYREHKIWIHAMNPTTEHSWRFWYGLGKLTSHP